MIKLNEGQRAADEVDAASVARSDAITETLVAQTEYWRRETCLRENSDRGTSP
jgi:hypothetical protein